MSTSVSPDIMWNISSYKIHIALGNFAPMQVITNEFGQLLLCRYFHSTILWSDVHISYGRISTSTLQLENEEDVENHTRCAL